eukprot:CAMPEP_0202342540 /NCGR_PEP_ID=MMETSP1126-20121109/3062_1 /ASSEMBLY_ACC=CAM_ASM_000457 /TAXON_ID=3047 /ORGANISM="Dunaliella tertiolecta, Strain CCMP1320" /LENGTH=391 /DNA_ID=CAMNT_0048933513 /DNA_START=52 /DNA_END=1227 /DNA_ORIENTATION=-
MEEDDFGLFDDYNYDEEQLDNPDHDMGIPGAQQGQQQQEQQQQQQQQQPQHPQQHQQAQVAEPARVSGHVDHAAKEQQQVEKMQSMQKKLMDSLMEANKWRSAFKEVAALAGYPATTTRDPDVQGVLDAVQRMKSQGQKLQEEARELHRHQASMQIALADRNLEAAEMRQSLGQAWSAADPNIIQLKQLLLDPAVNHEFLRMRSDLEETQKELKRVQEELAVANFTQESKVGRQLMAKCRSLATENEELGRELVEGRVPQLEQQLAIAKNFTEDLKGQVLELLEHCKSLNAEVEELQREAFGLRRKVKDYEAAEAAGHEFMGPRRMGGPDMGPGMMPGGYRGRGPPRGSFKRGGGPPMGMMGPPGGSRGPPAAGMMGPPAGPGLKQRFSMQ